MKKLVFVYNADSGLYNSLADATHKVFSPKTYKCNLCKLTYGPFNVKKEWEKFVQRLSIETEFLHKDKFYSKYKKTYDLPAVFMVEDEKLKMIIKSEDINRAKSIKELKSLVNKKLNEVETREFQSVKLQKIQIK